MAAMDRSRLLAWLLVVVFLVCSRAAPAVCSSRPLAASDGDARDDDQAWVAAGSGGGGGGASGGGREAWNRRSLGFRSPSSPPAPLWNRPTTMPVPPPPWT
ncbi:hypothetical protein C2845_PM10G04450 [Panicum miliaceum]|uniref:Uncharacterized protein n=1 Tax=Panicum miliaceum TaxID=4540 RepID=A0A3L6PD97_PANMI|nr:hypothetical protein C2845_PM10G04450 [Panicum miliaceum]